MEETEQKQDVLALSVRQKQLRLMTGIILIILLIMVAIGLFHPFFHPIIPKSLPIEARKLMKVRLALIFFYWSVCLMMPVFLIALAYLDVREVRLKLLMAKRDIFIDLAGKGADGSSILEEESKKPR